MRRSVSIGVAVSMVSATALAIADARTRAAGQEQTDERRHIETIRIGGGGARLGVALEDVTADDVSRLKLGEERGALVSDVAKSSAAEKAGLQEGDVILSYQGERVGSAAQLRRLVRETPPGRRVAIEASRAGALQRLTASLEERKGEHGIELDESFHFNVPVPSVPPLPPMPPLDHLFDSGDQGRRFLFRDRFVEGRPGRLGLSYQGLSGQLARYFKVADGALLVTEVEEDGPAARAGARAGDVIVKVDGKAVTDGDVLRRTLADAPGGSDVTITVQRDGRPMDLKVTPRGEKRIRAPRTTT